MTRVGRVLGSGGHRTVYEYKDNPFWVVKIAKGTRNIRDNRREWDNWQAFKDTDSGQFMAPCIAIADDNKWMIQVRAMPTEQTFKDRLPWMQDLKAENCGTIAGRLVLVDYDYDIL